MKTNYSLKAKESILWQLYIHYSDFSRDGKNILVGQVFEIKSPEVNKFIIEYLNEDILKYENFDKISGCDHYEGKRLWIYENRTPLFIQERIPSMKRPDLGDLLEKVKLKYFDLYEYLKRTNGVCSDNRLFVHTDKDIPDFKNEWLHDISLRITGD